MYLSASILALAISVLAAPSSFLSTSTSWPTDVSWLHVMQKRPAKKTCHVQALGGGQDDSSSIISAFNQCQNNSIIILDGNYTVGRLLVTTFNNVEIKLTGSLQYTNDISYWSPNSLYLRTHILPITLSAYQNATTFWFLSGNNIYLHGPGTIDGNGQIWWDTYATSKDSGVAGGSSTTFARPIPLTVGNATNVVVEDLRIIQSPFWHQLCYQSKNVVYQGLHISSVSSNASHPTANSDAIDIYRSSQVSIRNWVVDNDDDCVSFKPNSTDIAVQDLFCRGSHGISVGSLGQYKNETDIVQNVYVNNITMLNAQNGARIKVFPDNPNPNSVQGGGLGHTFKNFEVQNVDYPILIDQCYNINNATFCAQYPSKLSISDIHYYNVHGSSSGVNNATVVQMKCSAECENITASTTNLIPPARFSEAQYICQNIVSKNSLDFGKRCTAPATV
ncbi:hypothetical protein FS837_011650 [Tulasnella sp. UAMH 9824]|nr:hypothetical protein FS837_011650 [Tulasnella sp. UAMH 9824]